MCSHLRKGKAIVSALGDGGEQGRAEDIRLILGLQMGATQEGSRSGTVSFLPLPFASSPAPGPPPLPISVVGPFPAKRQSLRSPPRGHAPNEGVFCYRRPVSVRLETIVPRWRSLCPPTSPLIHPVLSETQPPCFWPVSCSSTLSPPPPPQLCPSFSDFSTMIFSTRWRPSSDGCSRESWSLEGLDRTRSTLIIGGL